MTNRKKNNIVAWLIYSAGSYVVLAPLQMWINAIPVSVLLGFMLSMQNAILVQLYKLNGEKTNQ